MPKKYNDFIESEPIERRGKKPPHNVMTYIDVTCPHCGVVCAEITANLLVTKKATKCLEHLRVCPNYEEVVVPKRKFDPFTAIIIPTNEQDEFQKLKAQVERQQQEIGNLQSKTGLYDAVLKAVVPSLQLPLTEPFQQAQRTLKNAMIECITIQEETVPKSMYTEMVDAKNDVIAAKNEVIHTRDESLETYRKQLEMKEEELKKAIQDKHEAEIIAQEARKNASSASKTAERLMKERETLKSKFDAQMQLEHNKKRKMNVGPFSNKPPFDPQYELTKFTQELEANKALKTHSKTSSISN
jgi:hypothetical protein